jgi:Kef-type K+ transport system membrane component KefB
MKILKQPMIIWYIIAWTVVSFFLPHLLIENTSIQFFSNIWVSFLLFTIWLELNLKVIKDIWKTAAVVGITQILIMITLWFFASKWFGFDDLTSFYIWIWLAFSSTIVTLKILSEKDSVNSVYWRMGTGILVIQDIIAMILLLTITILNKFHNSWSDSLFQDIWLIAIKLVWLWVWLFAISKYIIPTVTKKIAQSQEYLFLFSIWRCMILWTVFSYLWFSTEIWALIAWVTLASSSYRFEIMTRIKPLKDFFLVMFFVLLGAHVKISWWSWIVLPIIVISLLVLVIKPLIITIVLWLMKHTHKNSFLTWSVLWQVSEFSFLLIWLGMDFWHIQNQNIVTIVTLAWLITIIISSYISINNEFLFKKFEKFLNLLPWLKNNKNESNAETFDTVLFGYGRIWSKLIDNLKKGNKNRKCLVVDYNPDVIEVLKKKWINCLYWDATEIDLLKHINLKELKVAIVTTKDFDWDLMILKTIKTFNPTASVILVCSHSWEQALELYRNWADYVIMPYYIWAKHASMLLEEYDRHQEKIMQERIKHIQMLTNG